MSLPPVPPLSEEFGLIECQLQVQLRAPKLRVHEAFVLSSPHVEAQFMHTCKSMDPSNTTDVFVQTSELQQPISEIASKGLKFDSKNGFRFRVGSFEVDREAEMIEVVRLTVALGQTLNFTTPSSEPEDPEYSDELPTKANLKSGYHSLCVSSDHDFVIFNASQIKACNLVRFEGGANLEGYTDGDDLCEVCGEEQATIWCVNDQARLCDKCDEATHSENKLLQKHKRMPLSEARSMMETCPVHKDVRVEYYCQQCQMPVCINCKMIGSHSRGEAASHPLISIGDAYKESLEAAGHEEPSIGKRKSVINDKLEEADNTLTKIFDAEQAAEKEIHRIASAAIEKAKTLTAQKALIVRSAKTELQRKLEELETLGNYLTTQKNSAGPLTFLRAFDRYSMIIANLQGTNDLPPELKIGGDVQVTGEIDVIERNESSTPRSRKKSNQKQTPQQSPSTRNSTRLSSTPIRAKSSSPPPSPESDSVPEQEDDTFASVNESTTPAPEKIMPEYVSLVEMAERKERKNRSKGLELNFPPFEGSKILTDSGMCSVLYLCLPFRSQPITHLLFSSDRDGRSIKRLHELVDGVGITCILVKKGDYIFGGFAAAKWNSDGQPFGEKGNSFLFSCSQNAHIPYRPQAENSCQLFATKDCLSFGRTDLCLDKNFDNCTAIIENSFGIGFERNSTEAQTFLAGEPHFSADLVEVWSFYT